MLVINLFGAPGVGKSTTAAKIFSRLKDLGIKSELVTEFAKDLVWEESFNLLNNQIYVFANQHMRLLRLKGKVAVAVVDSPLLLSVYYDRAKNEHLKNLCLHEFDKFENCNIYLNRTKEYMQYGRTQSELESNLMGGEIKKFLVDNNVSFFETTGDNDGVEMITRHLGINL
jgi:tRNA uridine 5-carbamoylmethylation protein Kti12